MAREPTFRLFAVDIPPGVVRSGTEYTSRGRYYAANLWRWNSGAAGPIGGWVAHSLSAVSGKARAILPWSDDDVDAWVGIGTHTHLYVMSRSGSVTDITPAGFTSLGRADAVVGSGYGAGPYGLGGTAYGAPRATTSQVAPASVWSLDTWGEYLVGVMAEDGVIYEWLLDTAVNAVPMTNAPSARAVLVTAERIVMALGAGGDPRRIAWSNREDRNDWTPSDTDYTGGFSLQTPGKLVAGRQIDGGNLIWTDTDLWLATFVGRPFAYGFKKRGTGCGAVSMNCMIVTDAGVFWMGGNSFWVYNGYSQPVECDVHDYVFSDINTPQISKVYGFHNSAFNEVTWRYPSGGSIEIDRYVTYNYRERHWTIGQLVRLSGADAGVLPWPLEMGNDGYLYDHEVDYNHGAAPYARTGPFEIDDGAHVVQVQRIIPDVSTLGDVAVTFFARDRPNGGESSFGPYSLSEKRDVRFTARQVEMQLTGADGENFRVGRFRLEGRTTGER